MARSKFTLNSPFVRKPRTSLGERNSKKPIEDVQEQGKSNDGPSVFHAFAYFLGLASIAVIVISGQFPWFTLAPAFVMLMMAHFSRLDAKFAASKRDKSALKT